ncbi:MAG: hypothetical protein NT159_08655, partial [Proteobacteria bacterium]|nr:hypothetical protein [Pseudomonadota bacterium]
AIPQAEPAIAERCGEVFARGGVGIWNRHGRSLFRAEIATLNAGPALLDHLGRDVATEVATIAFAGAVGQSLWPVIGKLAARHPGLTVVVADGTKLFIDYAELTAFRKQQGNLVGYRGISIAGVTLNPCFPLGGTLGAAAFLQAARQAFAGYDVADVMLEEEITERASR